MFVQLDPAERQQVRDQPTHPVGLGGHDVEEAVTRLGVVPGMALERLDEAGQGGQRRLQFVAGVGEEIDAHQFHAAHVGLVAQDDEGQRPRLRLGQGPGHRPPMPGLGAHAGIVGGAGQAAEQGLVHRLQHCRIAQHRDQQPAFALDTQQVAGGGVGQDDATAGDVVGLTARHDQDGVGQGLENAFQQGRFGFRRCLGRREAGLIGRQGRGGRASIQKPGGEADQGGTSEQKRCQTGLIDGQPDEHRDGDTRAGAGGPQA